MNCRFCRISDLISDLHLYHASQDESADVLYREVRTGLNTVITVKITLEGMGSSVRREYLWAHNAWEPVKSNG